VSTSTDGMVSSMAEQLAELYGEREKFAAAFGSVDADRIIGYVRRLETQNGLSMNQGLHAEGASA